MILSVSRRTDIPAFYADWFYNRLKEGFVYVRNPMNIHQVSKICLSPEIIDCIVFWSKNPRPMLSRLDELSDYMYYFQYTINAYDKGLEVGVPKKEGIINTFKELSDKIGPKRVIWRYDPILLTNKLDIEYHVKYFEEIAKRLDGYTKTCVISFVDLYKKIQKNLSDVSVREATYNEMLDIASRLFVIADRYGINIQTCAEEVALESIGISHGKCIDNALIEDLLGVKLVVSKDPNQRKECGCVQSIDIGEYNTCTHGCKYCYANFQDAVVLKNRTNHDPHSPLLIGHLGPEDNISERKLFSFIKIPEPFEIGDIVSLKHPEEYLSLSGVFGHDINLFKIESIKGGSVLLKGMSKIAPLSDILPVPVDGVADRWIYYDPVIAASFVFPGEEIPSHRSDYAYYMESFEHSFYKDKSYKQIISKEKLMYLHEIQHFLRRKFNEDYLKINEWKR